MKTPAKTHFAALLFASALLCIATSLAPVCASASMEISLSPEALADGSDVIMTATVRKQQSKVVDDQRGRHIYTDVTLTSESVLQGTLAETNIVLEIVGGTLDGITEVVSFSPTFQNEEKVLLFLRTQPMRLVGAKQGKRTIKDGKFQLGSYILTPKAFRSALSDYNTRGKQANQLSQELGRVAGAVVAPQNDHTNQPGAPQVQEAPPAVPVVDGPKALGGGQLPLDEIPPVNKTNTTEQ